MIWTCNLDGSDLTQIREGKYPKWSPDEKKIVFMYDGEIWTVNANGTDLTQITNTYNIFENLPSFSPDGKKIVYSSNEGTDGQPSWDINIWAMNLDGSQKTQLTELNSWDSWPIWGRNGVYFLSGRAQRPGMNIKRIWLLRTSL
jgi:Tol biopolymer transport system component